MEILGIDIGGSGIKAALVDTEKGALLTGRERVETPRPSTPEQVMEAIEEVVGRFHYEGPVGCGFPGVIREQVIRTAANLGEPWVGMHLSERLEARLGMPAWTVNDADAAGIAEMAWGAGRGRRGVVILVTVGTGVGTALFTDGVLLPNTELGHIRMLNKETKAVEGAELTVSDAARKREELKWPEWGRRLNRYLKYLDKLFWPECFIIGGGVARKLHKFEESLKVPVEVVAAELGNCAGIAGAALAAQRSTLRARAGAR